MGSPEMLAAVDLGSNSFHLVIARVIRGDVRILDRLRDTVRLAAGLGHDQRLDEVAQLRALQTLEQFGQRLRDIPALGVRAVGTSTLRKASNATDFLAQARLALGHPIEIVSGREEARLIYLGVAHSIADDPGRRLVVDIGGGSTECILGERFETLLTDSLDMGCVSYSARFFADGVISKEALRAAETAARLEMQPMERRYRSMGWEFAIGASGTVGAISEVLRLQGWASRGISKTGLDKLAKYLLSVGRVGKIELEGLRPDRAQVLPAGVAILRALFEGLEIRKMSHASGALREGVLYDLVGRIRHEDVRDRTIAAMAERWHIDAEQAGRVEKTALLLLRQANKAWQLDEERARQLLTWASRLHEVGLAVAYSGHHKHGAYLIANSDMPGFSRDEQSLLAELIRTHRRKLASLFRDLPPLRSELALRLAMLLRLAVLLCRSRSSRPLPPLTLLADAQRLVLALPQKWLDDHPLVAADLDGERQELADLGMTLTVRGISR
jgi:exopolyphosphatase/guanosine-5'-triphosphate,3'-diphosphate pyrophosphatase